MNPACLKVVIITSGVSSIVCPLLESRHTIAGIVDCHCGNAGSPPMLYRLVAAGYQWMKNNPPSLESVAGKKGVPYYRPDRVSDPLLEGWIRDLRPDIIVIYYAPILGKNIFSIAPLGTINLHPSLLPKYRGGHPLFWTAYSMETEGGVTVHAVDAGMDTGDILCQKAFPVQPGMSESAMAKLTIDHHGVRLLLKALDSVADGVCPRIPQPEVSPTIKATRVTSERLDKLIDWNHWPIERLWSVLRFAESWQAVTPPPPGWRSKFRWAIGDYTREAAPGVPGTVSQDKRGYYLVHPEGKVRLAVRYDLKRYLKLTLLRLKDLSTACLIVIASNKETAYPFVEF